MSKNNDCISIHTFYILRSCFTPIPHKGGPYYHLASTAKPLFPGDLYRSHSTKSPFIKGSGAPQDPICRASPPHRACGSPCMLWRKRGTAVCDNSLSLPALLFA